MGMRERCILVSIPKHYVTFDQREGRNGTYWQLRPRGALPLPTVPMFSKHHPDLFNRGYVEVTVEWNTERQRWDAWTLDPTGGSKKQSQGSGQAALPYGPPPLTPESNGSSSGTSQTPPSPVGPPPHPGEDEVPF